MPKSHHAKTPDRSQRFYKPEDISAYRIQIVKYDQRRINALVSSSFAPHLRTHEAVVCVLLHAALDAIEAQMLHPILVDWVGKPIRIDVDALLRASQHERCHENGADQG